MSSTSTAEPLALGIYRFSDDGGRSAKGKLHTDKTQTDTIHRIADVNGLKLAGILDERSISGGTPLEQRPYGEAIKRVQAGEIQAIIFAYRTRHDRDVIEGAKAIELMDKAGGVLLVGGTVLTHATPDKWLEATMGSVMGEWQKRQITYQSHKGVARAVALGRVPYPSVPLGFILNDDHTLRLAPERVLRIVREAFAMRAANASIDAVRRYLAEHGHRRGYQAVRRMLHSPLYVGEIRFGLHENLLVDPTAPGWFPAIVDRDIWDAVQAASTPTGRLPRSERLLSRQGILLCATCGGRMSIGTTTSKTTGRRLSYYRCGRGRENDCPRRAVIMADVIEDYAATKTQAILADAEGKATAVRDAIDARAAADAATTALSRARRRLATDPDHTDDEVREILAELEATQTAAEALAKELEDDCEDVELVNAAKRWDELSLDARRRLVRASIRSIRVKPGRGGDPLKRCALTPKRKKTPRLGV